MQRLLLAFVLTLSPSLVFANEIRVSARAERADVFLDGARVTRVVDVALPAGRSTIVIPGLPSFSERTALAIRGRGGFEIVSTTTVLEVDSAHARTRRELQAELSAVEAELFAANVVGDVSGLLRPNLRAFILGSSGRRGATDTAVPTSVAEIEKLVEFLRRGEREPRRDTRADETRRDELQRRLRALNVSAPGSSTYTLPPDFSVRLEVEAPSDVPSARLEIITTESTLQWTPVYEADLVTTGPRPRIALTLRATIVSRAVGGFENIGVTLSTARLSAPSRAAGLAVLRVTPNRPDENAGNEADLPAGDPLALEPLSRQTTVGFDQRFVLQRPVTIPAGGEGTLQTRLAAFDLDARVFVQGVPLLDDHVFLMAAFRAPDNTPLIGGEMAVFRDGVPVGAGVFLSLPRGAEGELGFGQDRNSLVLRTPEARNATTSGIFGNSSVHARETRITVRNFHDRPMRYVIDDRMPFSETAELSVEPSAGSTPPDQRDIGGRRGFVRWSFELPAGGSREIRHGWRISGPRDQQMFLIDQRGVRMGTLN